MGKIDILFPLILSEEDDSKEKGNSTVKDTRTNDDTKKPDEINNNSNNDFNSKIKDKTDPTNDGDNKKQNSYLKPAFFVGISILAFLLYQYQDYFKTWFENSGKTAHTSKL